MAENSKIEWTDHTVNFWWGCAKVSPACANCYAESQAARFYAGNWGPDAQRRARVTQARNEALRYERRAVAEGRRFRVFTNSMSDFFEDRRDLDAARLEALDTIRQTPHLDWLILTKRPEKILDLLGRAQKMAQQQEGLRSHAENAMTEWLGWWLCEKAPSNVWLGTTAEDQERADLRIPALLQVPAAVRFLSCEPLLGPVDLEHLQMPEGHPCETRTGFYEWSEDAPDLHWVIAGGESGSHARPMHPDWARGLRDQCAAAGVPFLFKQWGEWCPAIFTLPGGGIELLPSAQAYPEVRPKATFAFPDGLGMERIGKAAAGRLLDGVEHNGYPEVPRG